MPGTLIKLTNAGRAALVGPENVGTVTRTIVQIGVATAAFVHNDDLVALPNELKRLNTFGGENVADDTVHVTLRDDTDDQYTLYGFGLYLDNGALLGTYSQATPILEKSPAALMLLSADMVFTTIDAALLQFGSAEWTNPPATEIRQGVAEIATQGETDAGLDDSRIITPKKLAARVSALVNGAPALLDTLGELAAAIANDPNYSATVAAALALKAPLASPDFSGVPKVPTAAPGTNSLQAASTAYVMAAIAALVNSSPAALDTLNELATALGNDPNFATTMTNALAARALLAGNAGQVFSVAGATAGDHAVSRNYGDARYLLQSGGAVAGALISQGGIYMMNNTGYKVRTTGGADISVMYADTGNTVVFGNAGLPTFLTGSTVWTGGALSLGAPASSAAHAVRYDQAFGLGQSMLNVTASRALGANYTNTTGKPIIIHVVASATAAGSAVGFFTGGFEGAVSIATSAGSAIGISAVVAPGTSYAVIASGGASLSSWLEIR